MKTSLVTGCAGFIGSHLTDYLLNKNHKVIGVDSLITGNIKNITQAKKNKNFKYIKSDICEKKIFNKIKKLDYVFHIAGLADIVPSIENPVNYHNSNVNGTLNIIENIKKFKIKKLVYAASSSCYGPNPNYPTNENNKIATAYPYALTKYIAENYIDHWSKIYNIPYISLRLFNVYGIRSRTNSNYGAVFGVFLKQILENKPLTVVGNGKQKRDFIHVKDVVRAFYKSATSKYKNKIYNVGSNNPVTILKLTKLLNAKKITFIPKRPGEPLVTNADINKIKRDLNWSPSISINQGVNEILQNINLWKNAPLWDAQNISNETKLWFKHLK
tara:strand:+ start:108 stop:1094 length:987 start_codon:yes stop_codon:yes gene_type:complete